MLFVVKNLIGFCSSVSVNTGQNPFPVNYNLISITVLTSDICFSALLMLLRDFIFEIFLYLYIL